MNQQALARQTAAWGILLPAAAIIMITMGSRQTAGLFLSPLNSATGIGVVGISFAMAVGQFVWGVAQPIFGAVADRYGPLRVLIAGGLLLALGNALTTVMTSQWGLIFALGVVTAAGAGAGSFSILIGASAQRIPPEQRSFAAGFINAGGSFGQFVFAPLTERMIAWMGWVNAMLALAISALLTLPLSQLLIRRTRAPMAGTGAPPSPGQATAAPAGGSNPLQLTLRAQLWQAFGDRNYLLLHAGFFTCGFHIAFLVTHLPGEVALCGLPASVSGISIALIGLANIAGSLIIGKLGEIYRMKYLLFWMYLSRTIMILLYLAAPKTPMTFYVFAVTLGLTWLATVPPTAGLVGKLFGVRYLATLFGLTLLSHQVGGFLGAWLGGVAVAGTGNYAWMWYADAALALAAALVNLPIREARVVRRVAMAAG
jgi:MFS family permease